MTSVNDGEAQNMGREEHLEHDARYDRADEFMEVVMGHWDSWDDDALIIDKKSGRFADPNKVRRLDHRGKFFNSRGPFTVPRSPQGHPGHHPGRRERSRKTLRRPLGRSDFRERAYDRVCATGLQSLQG